MTNTKMRLLRVGKGLTINEASKLVGLSYKIIADTEVGRYLPTARVKKKFEEFYGLPFDTLIEEFKDDGTLATAISKMR